MERWSGQRDLNPRPRAWEARTLPLSYARSLIGFYDIAYFSIFQSHIQTLFIKNLNPSIADGYTNGFIKFDKGMKK